MNNIIELVKQVKESKANKVLLQVPEGLKTKAIEITAALEKEGIEAIISADPCYGACDLPFNNLVSNFDLIVHIGHNKFYKDIKTEKPVLYYPWEIDVNLDGIDFSNIKEKKIGLLTSVQYMKALETVVDLLEKQDEGKRKAVQQAQHSDGRRCPCLLGKICQIFRC